MAEMTTPLKVLLLRRWLILVAALRLLSVVIGLWKPDTFKTKVFDLQPEAVTDLLGRLFAAWTTVTCILCLMCARDPTNKFIYGATLASFLVALAFFIPELLIHKTMSLKCALSPMIVAGLSTTWMVLGYNYYTGHCLTASTLASKAATGKAE